jgi:hypothetical protein
MPALGLAECGNPRYLRTVTHTTPPSRCGVAEDTVAERDSPEDNVLPPGSITRDDGLWTAAVLFAAVLVFLGLAAYLYWHGTGKLPWQ